MAVSDIRVYAGPTDGWVSLKGETGPAGPTVVSANAGNLCKLGTDNRVLVSSTDLDARYVNVVGDSMTGTLTIRAASGSPSFFNMIGDNAAGSALLDGYGNTANSVPFLSFRRFRGTVAAATPVAANDILSTLQCITPNAAGGNTIVSQTRVVATANPVVGEAGVETRMDFTVHSGIAPVTPFQITETGVAVSGNITSTGTAHNFAANSITASAVAARPAILPTAASYTLKLADANGTIINTTQTITVSIIIPDNATVPFPIGTRFEILDASAASATICQAAATVTLQWNSNLTAVGQGQSGGLGSACTLPGPFSRGILYKIDTNSWVVIT